MSDQELKTRSGLFQILFALLWAFAIFFTDSIWGEMSWGDQIVPWMLVGYVVTNGLLLTVMSGKKRSED